MAKKKKNIPGQGTAKKLVFDGLTPSADTFDVLYSRYSNQYDKAKGRLSRGETMYLTKKSKSQFKDFYMAVANQMEADNDIASGTPKADLANQIVTRMVEESVYEYSNRQAKYFQTGLRAMGVKDVEVSAIRRGQMNMEIDELKEAVKTRGEELKQQYELDDNINKTNISYLIRKRIGIEFFGSPE